MSRDDLDLSADLSACFMTEGHFDNGHLDDSAQQALNLIIQS